MSFQYDSTPVSLEKGGDVRQVIVPPAGLPKRTIQRMAECRGRLDALNGLATSSGHILEAGVKLVNVSENASAGGQGQGDATQNFAQVATPQKKGASTPASGGPIVHPHDIIETVEDLALQLLRRVLREGTGRRGGKVSPGLARRLRDFQFGQEKCKAKYGDKRPWGILGLYYHLAAIRIDAEWAEDAALRRNHNEP